MSDYEPPPDELKDLFAAEKAAPTIDASTRAALRSRLAATVGNALLGHVAAGTALGGAGKALAIVALMLAAGGGAVIAVKHARSSAPVEEHRATAPANVAAGSAPNPVQEQRAAAEITTPERAQNATVRSKPEVPASSTAGAKPAAHDVAAPSEVELLKRAWTALSVGEPEQALQIAEQDAQLHPDGVLAEEREAVQIAALAKLHRMDEARSSASHFIQENPTSVHRALVERAIQREEAP